MNTTTQPSGIAGRIDDIEVLRALAVFGVLIHHAHGNLITWPVPWFDALNRYFGFWSGVDLFFAISGFVIARSLLPDLRAATGRGNVWRTLSAFWIRRCFRLLPSAWLWLALVLAAVVFYNNSGVFGTLKANLWATVVALANVANFRFADAFMRYEYGATFVYWSLSLEEQFYVLLPLSALLLRRHLPWLLVAAIVFQALLPMRSLLMMSIRTDALAWGVLLAIVHGSPLWKRMQPIWLGHRWLRLPCVFVLLGLLPLASADQWGLPISQRMTLVAAISVALVWLASYDQDYFCRSPPIKRLLLWAGSRSYAIYLIHVPAYFFIRETLSRFGVVNTQSSPYSPAIYAAAAILIICLMAEATYRLVDSPFRRKGKALATRMLSGTRAPALPPLASAD